MLASAVFSTASYAVDPTNVYSDTKSQQLRAHVLSLAKKSNDKLILDLSDEKQYQFIMHRLQASNNTPENSPQLYRMLKKLRNKHLKKPANLKSAELLSQEDPSVTDANAHKIFGTYVIDNLAEQNLNIKDSIVKNSMQVKSSTDKYLTAKARSSVEGGTNYTLVDLLMFDEQGRQVGTLGANEAFAGGKEEFASVYQNLTLLRATRPELFPDAELIEQANKNGEDLPSSYQLIGDSMSIIGKTVMVNGQPEEVEEVTFKAAYMYMPPSAGAVGNITQPKYEHIHPKDINADGKAMLCLNRSHADCDYAIDQAGQSNENTFVHIPWEGTISLPHRIVKIYAPSETVDGINEQTEIRVSRKEVGGATKLQSPDGKEFYDYINVFNDEVEKVATISWNISREKGLFANAALFDRYQAVDWWLNLVVETNPYFAPRRSANALITTGTFDDVIITDFAFDQGITPLEFAYSCLAKGSLITMADGTQKAIENIKVGEVVVANGVNMLVDDISVGVETIPMTRLVDKKGREVLLTESHPVIKPGNRAVWASEVKVGDLVMTATGPSRIVKVSQEMFDEGVFNLKLTAVDGNLAALAPHSNAFLANDFLVGDLKMQADNEFKHLNTKQQDVLSRLPKAWHDDYMMRQNSK